MKVAAFLKKRAAKSSGRKFLIAKNDFYKKKYFFIRDGTRAENSALSCTGVHGTGAASCVCS